MRFVFPVPPALAFVAFCASAAAAAAQVAGTSPDVVIAGVHVIDVRTGEILRDRAIAISDGVITRMSAGPPEGDSPVIDGRGAYVIPGLLDVHAHVRANEMPDWISTDWMMPLLLAHGVTGVRDMASDCAPGGEDCAAKMREWQRRIEAGELAGPRLLALSSYPLNSPRGGRSRDEWRALIRGFDEKGLDLIKVYFRLSPDEFAWIMDEAAAVGLDVAGHIPLRVSLAEASEAGLRSVEHARDFLFDCHPGATAFRAAATSQNPSVEQLRTMVDDHDAELCEELFRTLVRNDTWYVPTHITRRMDAFADDPAFRGDARSRFLPPALWNDWNADADRMVALDSSPEGRRAMRDFYEKGLAITGAAHRAGVRVLMGTDGGDSFAFPGSGAHDELGELVKAGLSPAEALRAATLSGAEFLRIENRFGTIEPGKAADFLLLDANPLDDIDNVRGIRAIVFRGEYLDRGRLDALLEAVEAAAQRPIGGGS